MKKSEATIRNAKRRSGPALRPAVVGAEVIGGTFRSGTPRAREA
jgi:hypothetical protein